MEKYKYIQPKTFEDFKDLPFIKRGKKKKSNWELPKGLNYNDACKLGTIYAVYFIQYQKESKMAGGNFIGALIRDMEKSEDTSLKGVAVGFFSTIETVLYYATNHIDIWALLNNSLERSFEIDQSFIASEFFDKVGA